jgi:hypothetical protein
MNPLFDVAVALGYAGSVGTFVGIIFRAMPSIKNKYVPFIVWAVSLIGDLSLVLKKFTEAAGIQVVETAKGLAPQAQYAGLTSHSASLAVVFGVVTMVIAAFAQTAISSAIHDHGISKVLYIKKDA